MRFYNCYQPLHYFLSIIPISDKVKCFLCVFSLHYTGCGTAQNAMKAMQQKQRYDTILKVWILMRPYIYVPFDITYYMLRPYAESI